jgi:hypothetical protein
LCCATLYQELCERLGTPLPGGATDRHDPCHAGGSATLCDAAALRAQARGVPQGGGASPAPIHQLNAAAEERLALIQTLDAEVKRMREGDEERLTVIGSLEAEVKRVREVAEERLTVFRMLDAEVKRLRRPAAA